jgi:hypothetical protein
MYDIEMWGLNGAWKEVDKVHSIFCKKNYRYTNLRKWNLAGRVGEASV